MPKAEKGLCMSCLRATETARWRPQQRTPGRMVKARCSSWLGHDVYEDVLAGLYSAEEMVDFRDGRTSERILDNIFDMVAEAPAVVRGRVAIQKRLRRPLLPPTRRAARHRGPIRRWRRRSSKNQSADAQSDWESLKARAAGFVGTEFHGAMQEAWRAILLRRGPRRRRSRELSKLVWVLRSHCP